MGAISDLLIIFDDKRPRDGDAAFDRLVDRFLFAVGAICLGGLIFLDLILLDVSWTKALLICSIATACLIGRLGIWTTRKLTIVLTIYACAYVVGAVPPLQSIGSALARVLDAAF